MSLARAPLWGFLAVLTALATPGAAATPRKFYVAQRFAVVPPLQTPDAFMIVQWWGDVCLFRYSSFDVCTYSAQQ